MAAGLTPATPDGNRVPQCLVFTTCDREQRDVRGAHDRIRAGKQQRLAAKRARHAQRRHEHRRHRREDHEAHPAHIGKPHEIVLG
jgi:hypothetical protein